MAASHPACPAPTTTTSKCSSNGRMCAYSGPTCLGLKEERECRFLDCNNVDCNNVLRSPWPSILTLTDRLPEHHFPTVRVRPTPISRRPVELYCLNDTARRSRLATGRPFLNAGMNFQVNAALIRPGAVHFTFPAGSADLTFPDASMTKSKSASDPGTPCCSMSDTGGRRSRIALGGITANLRSGPDLLTVSKICACFFLPRGGPADVPSAWL